MKVCVKPVAVTLNTTRNHAISNQGKFTTLYSNIAGTSINIFEKSLDQVRYLHDRYIFMGDMGEPRCHSLLSQDKVGIVLNRVATRLILFNAGQMYVIDCPVEFFCMVHIAQTAKHLTIMCLS